jgi:hypothetical protein
LRYKGFEVYRDKEGYSPLFVLRDKDGKVFHGAYFPLQSIRQKDGTYFYRSGTADAPGSFHFPQDPDIPPIYRLQTTYYPDKKKDRAGEVFFRAWQFDPGKGQGELFKGKVAFKEMVNLGDFFLSMDEVRYWASMKLIYRPGVPIIFGSFWVIFVGVTINVIIKMVKSTKG